VEIRFLIDLRDRSAHRPEANVRPYRLQPEALSGVVPTICASSDRKMFFCLGKGPQSVLAPQPMFASFLARILFRYFQ
jgi:hypothetical protein